MTEKPSDRRKLITISVPVYNEAENIDALIGRLQSVADGLSGYDFEFLFTDNASQDDTFGLLAEHALKDARIRVLRFSRNFGFQNSILTNYLNARGEAAIQLDADLQDPPELIANFLKHWEDGYKVVYGVRRKRKEGALLTVMRKLFYRLLHAMSDIDLPVDAGDFRLIDRQIIDQLAEVRDQTPYVRAIIASMGHKQMGVPYDRDARERGKSKFNALALTRLAFDGFTANTTRPLELITLFGFGLTTLSFLAMLGYATSFLIWGAAEPGFVTLVLLLLFGIGVNSTGLGLLGEYIGRIYKNTRRMPLAIIEQKIDSQAPDHSPD